MVNVSFMQSNFQGGEVSPAYQGRMDEKEYVISLATCLNYIPAKEGSLIPRSGFRRIGNTKFNAPAKIFPFRFTFSDPYVVEFTNSNARLWSNGLLLTTADAVNSKQHDAQFAFVSSVAGDPPVFTLSSIPTNWDASAGDNLIMKVTNTGVSDNVWELVNREFQFNVVDPVAKTITLSDSRTGSPVTGTYTIPTNGVSFYKICDIANAFSQPQAVRMLQYTSQTVKGDPAGGSFQISEPDQRVTFFAPDISPRSFSSQQTINAGMIVEKFIDGPYLDSAGNDIPLKVSGTSGSISVTLHQYDSSIIYSKGDVALDYYSLGADPYFYVSLTDGNKGNALSSSSPYITANWARLNTFSLVWASGTTYGIGVPVTAYDYGGTDAVGDATVYYSQIAANTGNDPRTDHINWKTTPPAWSSLVTYAEYSVVTYNGADYVAVSAPVVGTAPTSAPSVWLVCDFSSAMEQVNSTTTGLFTAPQFHATDAGNNFFSGTNNPGRLIRLKWGPQPWLPTYSYASGDLVNYNDDVFKSLVSSNSGNTPGQDFSKWELQPESVLWTWGEITDASTHNFIATVNILGAPLPDASIIWEMRLGVFSDTTGWPICGTYHEGRVCLAGVNGNRFDAGVSNEGFNFTPTAPDGTVSDSNAISYTLNAADNENINAMASTAEGIVLLTSSAEWLVSASNLNDPLTPTSIQAHKTTNFSAAPSEVTQLPSAISTIQAGGRRVMEYQRFIDMTSYQSRLNAIDLTRRCQHLTEGGIYVTQYQSLPQPVLWCCTGGYAFTDLVGDAVGQGCAIEVNASVTERNASDISSNGRLFGIGYARNPDMSYIAPFSFEHGRSLATNFSQVIFSIANQRSPDPVAENLYATVQGSDGLVYMEMLMPCPHTTDETKDFFVDSGVTPSFMRVASDALSVTFYGLYPLAGLTVSFTILGKYVGDFAIGSDGTVNIPFSSDFADTDLGKALATPTYSVNTPSSFQTIYLDANGDTNLSGYATSGTAFYGQFGYKFRRRGQLLRPPVNGANGPSFGKTRRNHRMAVYTDQAQEISIGSSFSKLRALKLALTGSVAALGPADFATGIFRDTVDNDYGFDGNLAWEQVDPVRGSILAVGGFLEVVDV